MWSGAKNDASFLKHDLTLQAEADATEGPSRKPAILVNNNDNLRGKGREKPSNGFSSKSIYLTIYHKWN